LLEEQARNFEIENQNLVLQYKNLQKNFEEVNTLYVALLQSGGGTEGKVQHINKIKSQSNQANQQLTQLAIEINQHKK